jgi:hypothetical protein
VHELGYEPGDLAHLSLKLFQYMTSCKARRAAEHEDMTWWEFLQGEKFSLRCRAHMERGPEVLGAMTATESDVRTQGNMVTQLLIDQLVGRSVTDATLNGPTSLAWFDHWREYLVFRGVKFFRGMLVDFDLPDEDNPDHRRDVLLPRVAIAHHTLDPRSFTTAVRPHYFVLAAPVTAMMGRGEFVRANPELDPREDTFGVPGTNLAARFLARHTALRARLGDTMEPAAAAVDDFVSLQRWEAAIAAEDGPRAQPRARRRAPCGTSAGVQFFFPANVQFGQEHTLYMESGWRLSSISQVHFWHRRPTGSDGYRGIVSVDLGAMHRPLGRDIPGREGAAPHATHAWNLPPRRHRRGGVSGRGRQHRRQHARAATGGGASPARALRRGLQPRGAGASVRPRCPCRGAAARRRPAHRPRTRCAGPSRPSTRRSSRSATTSTRM